MKKGQRSSEGNLFGINRGKKGCRGRREIDMPRPWRCALGRLLPDTKSIAKDKLFINSRGKPEGKKDAQSELGVNGYQTSKEENKIYLFQDDKYT